MKLWHFTCAHQAEGIRRDGLIRPNPHALFPLLWLTDLPNGDRDALGLTTRVLTCDRTEFRFLVDPDAHPSVMPWWRWCRERGVTRRDREVLESIRGAQPIHWWVSEKSVRAVELP